MTRYPYQGADERVYPAYLDASTGRTLTAEPGGEYDIVPVDEAAVPPRDGRWPYEEPEQDQADLSAEAAPPAAEPDKSKSARKSKGGES